MSCTDVQTIQAGNGTKTQFSFDFPYIFKSEIHVYFWNATTKEWDEKLTTDGTYPWRITDANPTIVEFTSTAPPSPTSPVDPGEPTVDNVKIRRITNLDDIRALFNPGSAIRSDDLNNNFEQLRYAIQESNCPGVPEEVQEYLEEYYWDRFDNTLYSADTWRSNDATIATTAALDARFQDEVSETITSTESWPSNDDTVGTTLAVENRVTAKIDDAITNDIAADSSGITVTDDGDGTITLSIENGDLALTKIDPNAIITSAETWANNDDTVATTAKIDDVIDDAITGDILIDTTGLTKSTSGGQTTLGIGAGSVDIDRIKAENIITEAEQDSGTTETDDNLFTAVAAAKRFDTLVQTNNPGTTTNWEVGKTWLQNDDDLTLSIYNGTGWTAVTSGGTFTEQPSVVYVDQASGDDNNTGHRISTPKATIRAAINQINADIDVEITNGGSGYVESTYNGVSLTGGTGTGLTADIVVNASGVVTTVTVNNTTTLEDYNIGDVLSANNADLGGSGSGLQITVTGDGDGQIVIVSAGTYQEIAPIQIKRRNVSVIGQALRSCIVHPTSATENNVLFELNSGSYIANLTLTGMQAGTGTGNTLDAVLPTDQGWNFAFYNNAFITKSPYIQNCTNFSDSEIDNDDLRSHRPRGGQAGDTDSAPTGGGLLVNGATPHADSPLRSMVADSYTHVALNGPGILVTNNGYTQITSSYAFFNTYHIKCLNGGQANLAASTTDFGDRSLVADGRSTSAIFTSNVDGAANDGATTFNVNQPTAGTGWFGDTQRPAGNMLVEVNSVTYPILSATPNTDSEGGDGWTVTISRPDPNNRSNNLGLNGAIADDAAVSFFLRSMIASSGHTMEYVGSGTNYTALPENGGVPDETRQITESNNGKVWTAITDHNGKFRIGGNQTDDPIFEVDQQLGFVTIPEGSIAFNLLSDETPQLGGNLDVQARTITTSTTDGNITLDPNGTGVVDVSTSRIVNVTDPTGNQDAATKAYVDTEIGAIGTSSSISTLNTSVATSDTGSNGTITFTNDGSESARIDSSGRLLVGETSSTTVLSTTPALQVVGSSSNQANISILRTADEPSYLHFSSGSSGNNLVDDKVIARVNFAGYHTSGYTAAARIDCAVDGTPGENDMPGRLSFFTTADGASSVTERMRIDSSGRVGIGTANPNDTNNFGGTLDINATSGAACYVRTNGSTTNFGLIGHYGTDFYVQNNSNGPTRFFTNGGERARIDSSGRLLVGTSSEVSSSTHAKLQVVSTGGGHLYLARDDSSVNAQNLGVIAFSGNAADGTYEEGARIAAIADGTHALGDKPTLLAFSTTADGASSPTERMRIDSSGRVGIGSPANAHDFASNANQLVINTSGNGGLTIATGSSSNGHIFFADGTTGDQAYRGIIKYEHGNDAMTFGTAGGTERARIDSSGRLLVGTSSSATSSTAQYARLQVKGHYQGNSAEGIVNIQRGESSSAMSSGDKIGNLLFTDQDGGDYARIEAHADATPGTNDFPGRLSFWTTADGASSPTERVRIESNGKTKFSGSVYGNETTITASDFDLNDGNFFTCGAIAIPNPTNGVAGMSGLIRVTAAPTSFGSNWDFPGGSYTAPTAFPAVAPFYIVSSTQFYLGNWTEGIA